MPCFAHRLFTALVLTSLSTQGVRSQAPDAFAEFRREADALVAKAMDRDKVTGVSLLVAFGENVVLAKGYGLADVEHEVPVTPETVFQIGSVTKQFTAAAILKLVDAGKLRLEDKLRDVLPDYPFSDERVTVHQLLNHTSGITSYTRFRKEFAERGDRPFRHRDFYGYIKDEPFEFEPGTAYKYCNSGYYLLGMIIEEVSGVSYRKFLDDELLGPIGLDATYYGSDARIIKHRASGYSSSGLFRQTVNVKDGSLAWPFAAGVLLSTTRDLHRWSLALHGGRVLSEGSYERMTTPTSRGTDDRAHSYGYGLNIHERDGRRVFVHGGSIPGFRAFHAFFPASKLSIVMLSNKFQCNPGPVVLRLSERALAVPR